MAYDWTKNGWMIDKQQSEKLIMEMNRNLGRVLEGRYHLKNGSSSEYKMSRLFFLLFIFLLPYICSFGQYQKYEANLEKGKILRRQGNNDEALKIHTEGTKQKAPNNVNSNWFELGFVYYNLEKYDDAIDCYNKYLEQAAHPTGSCASTINYNGINYCLTKGSFAAIHSNIGYNNQLKGNLEKALFHYNIAIGIVATSQRLENRGGLYRKQGKLQEAINDYKQVIKDKSYAQEKKDSLTNIIIEIYESTDYYAEFYDFLKQLPNKNAEHYNKLAFSSYKLNKLEETDKYYDEALKLQPSLSIDISAREESKKYVAELQEKNRQEKLELERQREIQRAKEEKERQEANERRFAEIKKAEIGEKLLYSESWQWRPGLLSFRSPENYTMYVVCFIERIEGERYQLRVGDVQSSSSEHHTTPVINGVRANKGDIIWAKPLEGTSWVYGE